MKDFKNRKKIQKRIIWSDLQREKELKSFVHNSQKVCAEATFDKQRLSLYQKWRAEDLQSRSIFRK